MQRSDVRYGQRVRINLPGMGDHGQLGTVKKVRNGRCEVHLDWDIQPMRVVVFYAADLELAGDTPHEAAPVLPELAA